VRFAGDELDVVYEKRAALELATRHPIEAESLDHLPRESPPDSRARHRAGLCAIANKDTSCQPPAVKEQRIARDIAVGNLARPPRPIALANDEVLKVLRPMRSVGRGGQSAGRTRAIQMAASSAERTRHHATGTVDRRNRNSRSVAGR
jgi:hypothetical protein